MPRKTETIETHYRGVTPDGEVVKESKFKNAVVRAMRHYPDGEIESRDLVGYYTPWAKVETGEKPEGDA